MRYQILGVTIDQVTMSQAVEQILQWIKKPQTKYIVTPNVEFIIAAQKDLIFRDILNKADLAIPDSARIGWAKSILFEKNIFLKLLKWPFFFLPKTLPLNQFDVVAGTDLMEELIKQASVWGFTVGFLGGRKNVAEKLKECLLKTYPKLKVTFAESGGEVDENGELHLSNSESFRTIPPTDILFVAFGQVKQEKWIAKNLNNYPVKVMMGVGGAFDYLSGEVPRAPKLMRSLGFEWLFRLIIQPWRIKRFGSLVKFVFLVTKLNFNYKYG